MKKHDSWIWGIKVRSFMIKQDDLGKFKVI